MWSRYMLEIHAEKPRRGAHPAPEIARWRRARVRGRDATERGLRGDYTDYRRDLLGITNRGARLTTAAAARRARKEGAISPARLAEAVQRDMEAVLHLGCRGIRPEGEPHLLARASIGTTEEEEQQLARFPRA